MNKFFNLKFSYLSTNADGELVAKKHQIIIEGINYQDAEQSAISFFEHFHLNKNEKPIYEISKIKITDLITDANHLLTDGINGLNLIHSAENDFVKSSDSFGLYKINISYQDLESKLRKTTIHVFAANIAKSISLSNSFIKKFFDRSDAFITQIKLENFESLLITNESYETAKQLYSTISEL